MATFTDEHLSNVLRVIEPYADGFVTGYHDWRLERALVSLSGDSFICRITALPFGVNTHERYRLSSRFEVPGDLIAVHGPDASVDMLVEYIRGGMLEMPPLTFPC